jgi:glyoxylase-like metal-dependent hydrolase (beta-lactamase superfamily II)
MLMANPLKGRTYATFAAPELLETNLNAAKARLAATPSADAQTRATIERQIAMLTARIPQEREIVLTPPTTTFSSTMTLHRGSREIQLYYFGRGHTDSDIVVLLPKERIVATGDLMESQISYAGDAWMNEWPAALDKLAALDFDTVLPGHGVPFKGKDKIRSFQSYLADFQKQVIALRAQGVSVEEAAKRVDLTSHAADWPQARTPGADVRAVQRIYDIAANPNADVR